MYVHIGDNTMVRSREIIVMLEKDTIHASEEFQKLFTEKKDQVIKLTNGSYKSVIFTSKQIYLSPIAVATLKKRLLKSTSYQLII
ncbi:extracellular matrix regulator RemB [Bacillus sp. FSL K6-3431]|uniref:extracellular matrix regulator RemB n=1 Tax=Bacillus sp. FSL K6-3431 TaxID=2921500 RepID=UPI0030FA17F2